MSRILITSCTCAIITFNRNHSSRPVIFHPQWGNGDEGRCNRVQETGEGIKRLTIYTSLETRSNGMSARYPLKAGIFFEISQNVGRKEIKRATKFPLSLSLIFFFFSFLSFEGKENVETKWRETVGNLV